MATNTGKSRSGARWGWLLTTLALGVALAVTSWANYRSARERGFHHRPGADRGVRGSRDERLPGNRPWGPLPELDSLVAAYADAGLRFVGMFSPEEGLTVLGGTPSADFMEPPPVRRGTSSRYGSGTGFGPTSPAPGPGDASSPAHPVRPDPQGGMDPADRTDPGEPHGPGPLDP